jgi:hypothetical protein
MDDILRLAMTAHAAGDSRDAASGEEVKHDQCDGYRDHDDDCSKRVCLRRDLYFERFAAMMSRCRLLKSPIELPSTASAHSQEEEDPVD